MLNYEKYIFNINCNRIIKWDWYMINVMNITLMPMN